jgi:hypothetical protein
MSKKLLLAYDSMALNEAFDGVGKDDFAELTGRSLKGSRGKKRNFAEANERFSVTRACPNRAPNTGTETLEAPYLQRADVKLTHWVNGGLKKSYRNNRR